MLRNEPALSRIARPVFEVRTWHVALALLAMFVLAGAYAPRGVFLLAVASLVAAAVYLWVHQFFQLMSLRDEELPGRYDKVIWALLMILAPPVGLLLLTAFQRSRASTAKPHHSELS